MPKNMEDPFSACIYIGEPIQHKSEYDCLTAIYTVLKSLNSWSYIFANFHIEGRQIDFAIFTRNNILLIEAKGYTLPVSGEINGQWIQHGPYGTTKIGNAYNQALNAKNALRDGIQKKIHINSYPNAAVIISPIIPLGSKVTKGDFKVKVSDLNALSDIISQPSSATINQTECQLLANIFNLEAVSSLEAATDFNIFSIEKKYITYIKAFSELHSLNIKEYISDNYEVNKNTYNFPDIVLKTINNSNSILIKGPSGCGKTLLITKYALSCIEHDFIPIFISAKDFTGKFKNILDNEVNLLCNLSIVELIRTSRILGKIIIIFLDGYNECPISLQPQLTRSLKAFSLRYNAKIIISSQNNLAYHDLLKIDEIYVKSPTQEFKIILSKTSKNTDHSTHILNLLETANSGLEASLIGEIGNSLPLNASKFIIFETYARKKLNKFYQNGIEILSSLANYLVQRARFNISIREFDRLCKTNNIDIDTRKIVLESNLIKERGDIISFSHELFFITFTAESVIRENYNNIEKTISLLNSPRFNAAKIFIIGAIEDDFMLKEVLNYCTDPQIITACADGECGPIAQKIINEKIQYHLLNMCTEAKNIRFKIDKTGWLNISIDKDSCNPQLKDFESYLEVITKEILSGNYFNEILTAFENMDHTIQFFLEKNLPETKSKKKSLSDGVFANAYLHQKEISLTKLTNHIQLGFLSKYSKNKDIFYFSLESAWLSAKTLGQYYFLIKISKSIKSKKIIPIVTRLLDELINHPYHFQLELIDLCTHLKNIEDKYRLQIINTLDSALNKVNFILNSCIIEALNSLGALEQDKDNYLHMIHSEINSILRSDDTLSDELAWGIYSNQYDHPFSESYWEEVHNLDITSLKTLLIKACRGANKFNSFFIGSLIEDLSEINDQSVVSVLIPYTSLPPKDHCMPQGAIEAFVNAHEALGKFAVELPQQRGVIQTEADIALLACAELLYWIQRKISTPQNSLHTLNARSILLKYAKSASAAALYTITNQNFSSDAVSRKLFSAYPDFILEICRQALPSYNNQIYYFNNNYRNDSFNIAFFCIQTIGTLGSRDDLLLLKEFCDHKVLGISAIEAIKNIELKLYNIQ